MSKHGEDVLMQSLINSDSLDTLAREGLPVECIPSESLRPVYLWALDYYFRGGRTKAPSIAAIRAEWGDLLDDHEIDMEVEPEETIEWVIDDLKNSLVWKEVVQFNQDFSSEMANSVKEDRLDVLAEYSSKLVQLSVDLENHESRVDVREALPDRVRAYESRVANRDLIYGMSLGLSQLDAYTRGIHPGELAVLAAGPKVGKSFLLAWVALKEWQRGKKVALYTMENSVEMTVDRIACLAAGVDSSRWQHAECSEEEVERVMEYVSQIVDEDQPFPFHVIQPEPGKRGVATIVRDAQLQNADSLIIDQLSFLEVEDPTQPRYLQIRELTHTLKTMISTGRDRMACLLAHHISREGVKAADKVGFLEMYHLAEGSEVERTADWVYGLHRSKAEIMTHQAKLQTLAARREVPRHFQLTWRIDAGFLNVRGEIDLDDLQGER